MPASERGDALPHPSMQSRKERIMLFYPYRNEFFIQMEICRTNPARADRLIEASCAKWAWLREERCTADPAQSNPLPAASRVLST